MLQIPAGYGEQVIFRFVQGGGRRWLSSVPEVQTVSLAWSIVVGLILICIQVITLWIVCRRHKRDMDAQIGTMAILTASMQPPEIRAHCRRVADISERIAREMKLPAKRLALVRAVAILHEIDGVDAIARDLPVEFSILGVADYYDVLTHDGSESMDMDSAIEEIRRLAGMRFDPVVVKALMRVMAHSNGSREFKCAAGSSSNGK